MEGGKTPFLIRRQGGELFAMAGLWERWYGGEEKSIGSCTIIITDTNDLVREIHDGMPTILGWKSYDAWSDPDNQDADALLALLKPVDAEAWGAACDTTRRSEPLLRIGDDNADKNRRQSPNDRHAKCRER